MRANHLGTLLTAIAVGLCSPHACASTPTDRVDALLESAGLDAVLAVSLRDRLETTTGDRQLEVGEQLAATYARLLAAAPAAERGVWLARSRELLQRLRGLDAPEFRIALSIALYEEAEPIVFRRELLLGDGAGEDVAAEDLRAAAEALEPLADRLDADLARGTRLRRTADRRDRAEIDAELRELRRQRSLARYYAGWARLQRASLLDNPADAREAVAHFASMVDADAGDPDPERLPRSLLNLDHVARSVLGLVLALDRSGEPDLGMAWFEQVRAEEVWLTVSPEVRAQFELRAISLHAASGRWSGLRRVVSARRNGEALPLLDARLLAVETLQAKADGGLRSVSQGTVDQLAKIALSDLVARDAFEHLVDVTSRFEGVPDLDKGFAGSYVKGLRQLAEADRAQATAGGSSGQIGENATVRRLYETASRSLLEAVAIQDDSASPTSRLNARYHAGVALHGGGLHQAAARELGRVAEGTRDPELRERALWLAIVTLDARLISASDDALARRERDRLANLYLESFGGSDKAVRLVIRLLDADLLEPDELRSVLRNVSRNSPVRRAARARLADLLYADALRGEPGAAAELAGLAQEALEAATARRATSLEPDTLLVLRRAFAVLLDVSPPEARSASGLLASARRIDAATIDSSRELIYRAFQIAVMLDDERGRDIAFEMLEAQDDRFRAGARRLSFTHVNRVWHRRPTPEGARAVLESAAALLPQLETPADRAVARSAAAGASLYLARALSDPDERSALLEAALRFDLAVIEDGLADRSLLERAGPVAVELDQRDVAIDVYQRLQSASTPASPGWYTARVELVRLLLIEAPQRARAILEQHRALYPDWGPEPWGPALRAMADALPPVVEDSGAP